MCNMNGDLVGSSAVTNSTFLAMSVAMKATSRDSLSNLATTIAAFNQKVPIASAASLSLFSIAILPFTRVPERVPPFLASTLDLAQSSPDLQAQGRFSRGLIDGKNRKHPAMSRVMDAF